MTAMLPGDIVGILSQWLRPGVGGDANNALFFCPFHKQGNEGTPSFYVYVGPETDHVQAGAAFCQACGEGWSFSRLLYRLGASRSMVDLASEVLAEGRRRRDRDKPETDFSNPVLPESVLGVFDWCPRLLLNAGFDKELLREHDIGFDRERKRITFPFRDHHGVLVGVSGRTVRDEEPRYKVYKSEWHDLLPNYSLDKRKILWGLDRFYMRRMLGPGNDCPVVICEGFKAALWVRQAGYNDVVALAGTAVSEQHILLLKRFTSKIILFLDNDKPGWKATWKAIGALQNVFELFVVDYGTRNPVSPDDLEPDEVLALIEAAKPLFRWKHGRHNDSDTDLGELQE